MNDLPRLSASKLKLYEKCPVSFKYRYLTGEREQLSIYGIAGSALHKAIELKYKEDKIPAVTFSERMIKHVTADVTRFEDFSKHLSDGHAILSGFNFKWYKPIELEKHFKLPYPDAENPICTIEGYIDLVEKTVAIDFKSGKDKVTIEYVENDLQFIVYYWAFKQLYGKYPRKLVYHRLKDHTRIEGKKFNLEKLDDIIHRYLSDPMEYEREPCDNCPIYCGVRKNVISEIAVT